MKRRVITWYRVASFVALLGLGCFALLWLPERGWYTVLPPTGPNGVSVSVGQGKVFVAWRPRVPYRPAWAGQTNRYGFRYNRTSDGAAYVGVPLVVPAAALAAFALAAFARGRHGRQRRRSPLLCSACGYDLRETPTRCPECGTVPHAPHGTVSSR